MVKTRKQVTLVLATFLIYTAYCGLEVIPERASVNYINEKYIHNYSVHVRRSSRNSSYFFNIEMTTKQEWNNNVSLHFIFNEYLHNEYRPSFIELHLKFCDLVKVDKFIGSVIAKLGLKCPMPAGTIRTKNFDFSPKDFPNLFPIQKSRIDLKYMVTATNDTFLEVYYYLSFKNKKM